MFTYKNLQSKLKQLRKLRGAQATIARELKVSPSFVCDVLRGKKKSARVWGKLAEVLDRKAGVGHGA
jgi:predicted transcriptional regulator